MSKIIEINDNNFEEYILTGNVLLKFEASWCGPCRQIQPTVEKIAESHEDLIVGAVDIEKNIELLKKYEVRSVPTFVVLKDGEVVNTLVGINDFDKDELLKPLGV